MENKLKLEDSPIEAITKMSQGNPGAAMALTEIYGRSDIDTDSAFGSMGPIFQLDGHGIYGSDIYIPYSDICEKDVVSVYAVLRAVQLGLFSNVILKDACSRQDRSGKALVPVAELYKKVKEQLPHFNSNL